MTGTAHSSSPGAGLDNFRQEVRAFLDGNLTPDLRRAGQETTGVHSDIGACRIWHARLFRKGWIAPAWPRAYGGTGWSAAQRFLFEQECANNDAPVLFAAGLRSIGPLIIASGSEQQKRRYLPPILSGEDLWCQGFSEAGAGSDLAALSTRAVRNADHYVINGRKLWTTGAHLANRMFALVRTRSGGPPQDGITFLLIDIPSPGLAIRPIGTLEGEHEFNEVVFEDVVVPDDNRLGRENEGWGEAKRLMRFARTNNTNSSHLRRTWRALQRMLTFTDESDAGIRMGVGALAARMVAFESLEFSYLASGRLSGEDEASASTMKLMASEIHQHITELLLACAGPYAAVGPGMLRTNCGDLAGFATRKYLATRAASIYSGTSEIHRNVIARQLGFQGRTFSLS